MPEENDLHTTLRRGWCFASDEFKEKVLKRFGHLMDSKGQGKRKRADGFTGLETKEHGEAMAARIVKAGMKHWRVTEEDLEKMKKGDWRKAMIARALRRRTTVPMAWIAARLKMGVTGRVSHAIRKLNEEEAKSRKMKAEGRKFDKFLSRNID